jgi:hypothetical protein
MQQGAVEFTQLQQGGVEVKKLPMFSLFTNKQ